MKNLVSYTREFIILHVHLWLIDVDVWQKTTKFCKASILQLKTKYLKKKKEKKADETHRKFLIREVTGLD